MSGEPKKTPRFLFWCDLETTGLSPREDDILEIAYALTEFRYPYPVLSRASFLVSCPGRIRLLQGECGEFIQGMHEASGLRADLSVAENTKTIPSIEADLLALSQDWPTDKDEKVVIAGSSVGTFDLQFLRNHLPTFTRRLSHRAFDISAVKLAARSLSMPSSSEKEPAHRASQDVDGSMEAMRRCVEWLSEQAPGSRLQAPGSRLQLETHLKSVA